MRHLGKTLVALALMTLPAVAEATAVIGGNTRVSFSSAISGLTPGLTGTASIPAGTPGLTVNFPITGGDLDPALAGTIRHDGSGVTLSNGTNTLALGNFVIDTAQGLLFGDVALNGATLGTALGLFSFDLSTVTVPQLIDLDNPLLSLLITPTTAGALTTAFGLGDTTGVSIGLAATAPQLGVVPEADSWMLLVTGFGLVGAGIRVQRRATIATDAA